MDYKFGNSMWMDNQRVLYSVIYGSVISQFLAGLEVAQHIMC